MSIGRHLTFAVHVEGLAWGDDSQASDGVLFHIGAAAPDVMGTRYHWEESLTEIPSDIDESLDLLTSQYNVSDANFALAMTEAVRKLLFVEPKSIGTVFVDPGVPTVIQVETTVGVTAGDFIYLGDETCRVSAVSAVSGTVLQLTVTRAWAGTAQKTVGAGVPVFLTPPYHAPRIVVFHLINRITLETSVVWRGVLENIDTNEGQTEASVAAIDPFSSLRDAPAMVNMPGFRFPDGALTWGRFGGPNGDIRGSDNNGFADAEWVNPNYSNKILLIDDACVVMYLVGGDLQDLTGAILARGDHEAGDPVDPSVVVREILGVNRQRRISSFFGVYGGKYNVGSAILALMLSTGGDGANNPEDPDNPGTYLDFDILGQRVGLGMPARLFDMASWKRVIDRNIHLLDNMYLGVDGPWNYSEVVVEKCLRAYGLFIARDRNGLIGLYELSTWTIDSMIGVMSNRHHTILHPGLPLDRQLHKRVPAVVATVGRTPFDDDPDLIREKVYEGDRRDLSTFAQDGEQFNLEFRAKSNTVGATGRDRQKILSFLRLQAILRRDYPPRVKFGAPDTHQVESLTLGGGVVPGVGQWVRLRRDDYDSVKYVGPDGEWTDPNETSILFIGRIVRRTLNTSTGEVSGEVDLFNWASGDVTPRKVAPAAQIESTSSATFTVAATYLDQFGARGFSAGDEIVLVDADGHPDYRDPGNLVVSSVTPTTVFCTTFVPSIGNEGVVIRLADPDRYNNATWDGAQYFTPAFAYRQFAYLADASNTVGTSLEAADTYS